MRLTRSRWLAVNSALLCLLLVTAARAETRPNSGGTLHIQTQATLDSLAAPRTGERRSMLAEQVARLIHAAPEAGRNPRPGATDGPFRVVEFVPGKKLTLAANDEYSGGRPFLDAIEILMARAPREQMVALQLGRADVIDVPAESMRQASQQGMRLVASSPIELVAIVFSADTDARVREAVSLAVDRTAIFNVLLGRQGEPTAALLPNWLRWHGGLLDGS